MGQQLARLLRTSSAWVARGETALAGLLAAAVACLILLNVVTRTAGAALFWVDEVAVYAMVWMAFLGASITIARRSSVTVTILVDALPARWRSLIGRLMDWTILGFALFLLWLCWGWYDLATLASLNFSLDAFSGETFNFMYREPTQTIGAPKYFIWLIVPLAAFGMSLHATANLLPPPAEAGAP